MTQTAYVFPGQGSQAVGMGKGLAQAFPIARATFAEADDILGFKLSQLCAEGPAAELTATVNAQPALLVTSIAALRVLEVERPDLPTPFCMAGHSLGEYSALVAAGALSFADGVRLTRARGEAMTHAGAANPGSMAAIVKLPDEKVAAICEEAAAESGLVVQVANYNSPGQVVISGSPAAVALAGDKAKAAGGRALPLAVSVAAHSPLMALAVEEFRECVADAAFRSPSVPVYGNVQAQPLSSAHEIREELLAQLSMPVRWTQSVQAMVAAGAGRFVELGSGNVLSGIIRRIDANVATANVAEPGDLRII